MDLDNLLPDSEIVGFENQFVSQVRDFEPGDENFILKCWMRSYYAGQTMIPSQIYYPLQERLIKRIWQRPTARMKIACDSANRNFISGFACSEVNNDADTPFVVHFVFVRRDYRLMGIAKQLMQELGWNSRKKQPLYVTHWTAACHTLRQGRDINSLPYQYLDLI